MTTMMLKNTLPALILTVAALLGACQGDPRNERMRTKEAVINVGSDPRSLDPSLASDVVSARAIMCFTRGLFVLDDKGFPHPELAASFTASPDGLVYDIKLRPARWSSGEPVTAEDFVYTWTRRMLDPKFGAEYAYQVFNYVKGAAEYFENQALGPQSVGVEAVAPDHLRVTLKAPTPFFPSLLAHHSYYPVSKKADQANPDWAKKPETFVGCGPFIITKYTPGYELTGRKNPTYWNAKAVGLEKITLRMIEQESTERGAFESGELDGTQLAPRVDIPGLRGSPELKISPLYGTYFLNFNCKRPIFKDPRVRRALALAIDRAAIVKNVTRADERAAFTLTPPELYKQPLQPSFKDAQFDEARRLLAEAGYPGGKGFPRLQYIYNTLESHQQIAQVAQEMWARELGIHIDVQNQEFKVLINNRRAGNFDIARNGWAADFADPINFLELFGSKSENNDSHFEDPKFDALIDAARREADQTKREGLLRDAERYWVEQMPAIPLYFQCNPYFCAPELEGYTLNPMDLFDVTTIRWKPAPLK